MKEVDAKILIECMERIANAVYSDRQDNSEDGGFYTFQAKKETFLLLTQNEPEPR